MDSDELAGVLEGILFGAGEPVSLSSLSDTLEKSAAEISFALKILKQDYASKARGIRLVEVEKTYQLSTKLEYYDYIKKITSRRQKNALSRAALETLAIIAYRQPITRHLIDDLRGVSSSSTIQRLMDYDLISEAGRLEAPGRPILYKTTREFLKTMGYKNLNELKDYTTFLEEEDHFEKREDVQISLVCKDDKGDKR